MWIAPFCSLTLLPSSQLCRCCKFDLQGSLYGKVGRTRLVLASWPSRTSFSSGAFVKMVNMLGIPAWDKTMAFLTIVLPAKADEQSSVTHCYIHQVQLSLLILSWRLFVILLASEISMPHMVMFLYAYTASQPLFGTS